MANAKTAFERCEGREGRMDIDRVRPEAVVIAAVDSGLGMLPEVQPYADMTAAAFLRRALTDPLSVFRSTDRQCEEFTTLVVTFASQGCPDPIEGVKLTLDGLECVVGFDGRHRTVSCRLANRILAGEFDASCPELVARVAQARAASSAAPDVVMLRVLPVRGISPLRAQQAIHARNIGRRVYSDQQRFDLVRTEWLKAHAEGREADAVEIADSYGFGPSEVRAALTVLRNGQDAVVERVSQGTMALSSAARIAPLSGAGQAQALAAMDAEGTHTVAAAVAARDAVKAGKDVVAAVRQTRERKGLSARETADLLESAKGASVSQEVRDLLRLIVEGPEALNRAARNALGLRVAIDAIENKRGGK